MLKKNWNFINVSDTNQQNSIILSILHIILYKFLEIVDCDYYNTYDGLFNQYDDSLNYNINIEINKNNSNDQSLDTKIFTFFVFSDDLISVAFTNEGKIFDGIFRYNPAYLLSMNLNLFM